MKILRKFSALAVVAALALTGCSGSDKDDDAGSGSAAAGSGSFPQTIETAFGDVTIESRPKRVVALGWGDAEVALELGVQPVGASDWLAFGDDGVGPWAEGEYDNAPTIIDTLKPNYEEIGKLEPDLILDVKSSGDKKRYEKLKQITPNVIAIPEGSENYLTEMDQQVDSISKALGVPDKGEELLKNVDDAYAKVADEHPEWKAKTVTAATKTSEGWGAYIEGGSRLDTLKKLGLKQNPTIAGLPVDESGFSVKISSENLDQMEADLIVAFPIYIDTKEITDDSQWKKLKAVKEGHTVVIDGDVSSAYSLGTPGASMYALDKLTPMLEKALPAEG
ncbi:MAG: iron-siderophore ABC transporter substrate-binding protein [Galactobacter sp.]